MRPMVVHREGDQIVTISLAETIIPLSAVPERLPRRRRGKKVHVSCLYRWSVTGCRGVVLETTQIGATRATSLEALERFFERLASQRQIRGVADQPDPAVSRRSVAQRRLASAKAGQELIDRGA
jgi:hypothetical protein